ncbi:MAG: dTMP kinase [Acidimicrobiales bacterium]
MAATSPNPPANRGLFIVFEGGDGSGKSTQAELLAEWLGARLTREPGGTAIGQRIRGVVLDPEHPELAHRTEALLMAADRAQHVAEVIRPALMAGRHVVSDRHVASSLAYQGVGRGLGIDEVQQLNDFGLDGLRPDLVVLLDVDSSEATSRLGDDLDRIEAAGSTLAASVRDSYRRFASADPHRWVVVDGRGTPDAVAERVRAAVSSRVRVQR